MRLSHLLLAGASMLMLPCVTQAQELGPEEITVNTLPDDLKRVYLIDLAVNHVVDGRVYILDGEKLDVRGMVELGFLGVFHAPEKSKKLYVATTFYDRLTRGKRTDAIVVHDANTLKIVDEFEIPQKRAMPITYRPLISSSSDEKFLFIQNATPATSIAVVDLTKKTTAELQAAGCYGTYPSITSPKRVSTICGDGTFATYTLNQAGTDGTRVGGDKIFDVDEDALFIHGERDGETYRFISFKGHIFTMSLEGEKPAKVDSFPIADGVEGDWRPGGYQPFAVDAKAGMAYVLMHSKGAEGTHKFPSEEIWSVDLKAKKVTARTKSPPLTSLTISLAGGPMFGINPLEASVVKITADPAAANAVTVGGSVKVGETATQIEASN
jgi:methylamine dehydrogenase heavy chain